LVLDEVGVEREFLRIGCVAIVDVQFSFGEFIHLCYLGGSFLFLSSWLSLRIVAFLVVIRPYGVGLEDDP
jgi:hypothetical protein